MRAKLLVFPAVYLNTTCKKHNCMLEVRVELSEARDGRKVGANLFPTRCHIGGLPNEANCTDDWEVVMSGQGPVTVTN